MDFTILITASYTLPMVLFLIGAICFLFVAGGTFISQHVSFSQKQSRKQDKSSNSLEHKTEKAITGILNKLENTDSKCIEISVDDELDLRRMMLQTTSVTPEHYDLITFSGMVRFQVREEFHNSVSEFVSSSGKTISLVCDFDDTEAEDSYWERFRDLTVKELYELSDFLHIDTNIRANPIDDKSSE